MSLLADISGAGTTLWTLLVYSQCAGGHHGAGLSWRRRCDDFLAVPRWDRAVGRNRCLFGAAGRLPHGVPGPGVENWPAMRRRSRGVVIAVTFVRYSYKGYRDHEWGGAGRAPRPSAHEPDKPTGFDCENFHPETGVPQGASEAGVQRRQPRSAPRSDNAPPRGGTQRWPHGGLPGAICNARRYRTTRTRECPGYCRRQRTA